MNKSFAQERSCAKCNFAINRSFNEVEWRCRSPQNKSAIVSLVTGEPVPITDLCVDQRYPSPQEELIMCGTEGRWFLSRQEALAREYHNYATAQSSSKKLSQDAISNL